jgi:hypothetical protein
LALRDLLVQCGLNACNDNDDDRKSATNNNNNDDEDAGGDGKTDYPNLFYFVNVTQHS